MPTGISLPSGYLPLLELAGVHQSGLILNPLQLYPTGEAGFWYDPTDLTAGYQESTGITPAALEAALGFEGDKRLGFAAGVELAQNGGFDSDTVWSKAVGWTIAGGVASFAATGSLANLGQTNIVPMTGWIQVSITAVVSAGNFTIRPGGASATATISASGTYLLHLPVTGTNATLNIAAGTTFTGSVDNISIKALPGNHASQSTAGQRPILKTGGFVRFDGVDDNWTCVTGGGGTGGFFLCTVLNPSAGDGTARTICGDNGTNTGHRVRLASTNGLALYAGTGAAYSSAITTDTVLAGTPKVVTVWHDNVNLYAQVGNGVIVQTACGAVTAGTAGYTIAKENGAASNNYAGDIYPALCLTNSCPTQATIEAAKRWMSRITGVAL